MQEQLFEEPTFSVGELSTAIATVLGRAFPDELWVRGEISNLRRHTSGHVYFDLTGDECTVAVTLFAPDRLVVNGVLRRAGGAVRMTDGTEIRIRARIDWFGRRGQLRLRMLSIDPAYTLGQLAEARERLVRQLDADGLLARQAALPLPVIPLRVGLVTSAGSAAAADFLHTLELSGWGWQVLLADARVQGVEAEVSVVRALHALVDRSEPPDVVCVVRGGGARTDLAAFDSEVVARAIATLPLPVLTGIGHEIDQTVADLVAHFPYKTPTACAGALVDRVGSFVERCDAAWARIGRAATGALTRAEGALHHASGRTTGACRHHLRAAASDLDGATRQLQSLAWRAPAAGTRTLDAIEARVRALDPARLLARGWSITHDETGVLVKSVAQVRTGEILRTALADGEVRSRVE